MVGEIEELTCTIDIDATVFETEDPILSGGDILSIASLVPATEHSVVMLYNRRGEHISLDRKVDLRNFPGAKFRTFYGDRLYRFTVNELEFVWGEPKISVTEIRKIAKIPEDHELILDSDSDRLLRGNAKVKLREEGVERVLSRKPEPISVTIIVNARPKTVSGKKITFSELVTCAFGDVPNGQNMTFTVTYRKGPGQMPVGSLLIGDKVRVKEGMVFNVTNTTQS